ncbi:uncharacterized protein LOC131428297 isoform X1 [Malaya genurostris]|uniref:uncharacterized protein LOC131428297 isoform X1 n=1 Tax=Malaya genurostris TaxID=325434 RepID=UPI0026F3C165|nr:uncharacterized protein LOC131428297 isoform X1 [Malaya genurostris]XP_058448114.1 uncharacterized protein LOC131428297 isoform X1 [Malaya genurostris]XP_058448115.1 uncharacterized protein LOC131428297 isoform X1 [Malaya genurostris]
MKTVRCNWSLSLVCLVFLVRFTGSIQIDNRLVQPQHDCFERIALGAMLPFEKTFRNSDTNSLKICETLCLNDKECQTFAFGISGRGNGTCQLSANVIDATNSRPVGTVFDPDFDLYARKYNCFLDSGGPSNPPPRPGGLTSFPPNELPPGGTQRPTSAFPPPGSAERPGSPGFSPSSTTATGEPISNTNNGFTDTRPTSEYPGIFSTSVGSTYNQATGETFPETTAPGEEYYTTKEQPSSTLSGHYSPPTSTASGQPTSTGADRIPLKQPAPGDPSMKYPLDFRPQYPAESGPSRPGNYPYQFPMLYETNYPLPNKNDRLPGVYAPSIPSLDNNYLRPEYPGYYGRPSGPSGPTGIMKPLDNTFTGYGVTGPQRPIDNKPADYEGSLRPSGTGADSGPSGYGITRPPAQSGPTGTGGYKVTEDKPDPQTSKFRPCYRRVLAGKRVAPQWVRRTLICERVEDCQRECGDERRFPCEGFNYRLDPTGRGQGDCELIDQPLSQIDLYSSPHQRDSNLIRDHDYDYYERDRSASLSCRATYGCKDCILKPYRPPFDFVRPTTYRPHADSYKPFPPERPPFEDDRYKPMTTLDKYRPSMFDRDFDRYGSNFYPVPQPSPPSGSYRPSLPYKPHYMGEIDRYGTIDPDRYKPHSQGPYGSGTYERHDFFRPSIPYQEDHRPIMNRPRHPYEDRDPPPSSQSQYSPHNDKPTNFVPYLIGQDAQKNWGVYGGSYGHSGGESYKSASDYWGIRNEIKRYDGPTFNYFELRNDQPPDENIIWNYGGRKYGLDDPHALSIPEHRPDRGNYGQQWSRRPGLEDCSVKSSEGFRLNKGVVKYALNTPTVIECERMCFTESRFRCHTFSYRYSTISRENCLLCDRPYNLLDFYADLDPDRDYDIYSMTDDPKACHPETHPPVRDVTAQCFIRTIDSSRFYKAIIRDSLTVRSVGECELECIKALKFTCRAFTYSFGPQTINSVIDNCLLSDWPVRDMDRDRHLVLDEGFDVFERASYGQGCEIQPIIDDKHQKKFCYLGYGSPAKLLSSAIKKVISVNTELDCKNECIRLRETTPFKCLSFSFGSQASTYNCEMSDLDQSELKMGVHYAHTNNRDYWLFAWNPFDYTCRDKIITISSGSNGNNRENHDRRMDIFREPGDGSWRQYTVSGKACRLGTKCERNKITGFYSCEIDGGEVGSWDYCCKTDHPCGYSQGFEYPWCYVGDAPDQWRKCSDKYFPAKHHHQHPNGLPDGSRYQDKNKKGEIYQPPPKPGGLRHMDDVTAPAELWPVTFLYDKGPPGTASKPMASNTTDLSSNVIDCKKDKC